MSNTNETKTVVSSIPFSENMLIKDVLRQYLGKANLSLDLSPSNCSFLCGPKILNTERI